MAPADGLGGAAPAIVIATLLRPQGPSGVQTHVGEFARYLHDRELASSTVTAFSSAGVLRLGVFGLRRLLEPLHGAAAVRWYQWSHRVVLERVLRRQLRTLGPAVVYCQCPVSARAALRARCASNQRVVLAVHFVGSQADEWVDKGKIAPRGRTYHSIRERERQVVGDVDGVVFVSDAARTNLWVDVAPGVPSVTIPNFVTMSRQEVRPTRVRDLVTVGSLEPHKNHAFLLETLAIAARSGHRYSLDVVGEGPERRSLVRRCHALGLDDQVRFLGALPDAARLLCGYRAYAHASRREALPLVIIEAMAAGLPVLAAPVGGIPQLFDEGVEGRFWSLDDPRTAAELLTDLLSDDALRAQMGAAARRRAHERYDSAIVGDALCRFLVSPWGPQPDRGARQGQEPGTSSWWRCGTPTSPRASAGPGRAWEVQPG